ARGAGWLRNGEIRQNRDAARRLRFGWRRPRPAPAHVVWCRSCAPTESAGPPMTMAAFAHLFLAASSTTTKKSSSSYTFLIFLVVIGVAGYFLLLRPQQQKARKA